ncbi:MAG: phosphatase PAP2 family protein [Ekhidna sp.]|nr:phosphatase PAP2 family protein [Ekhidna sp.]
MKITSVVFHPLLIATHLTGLFLYISPELLSGIQPQATLHFLLLVFLITGFLPAFSIFLLKKLNYVSDTEIIKRNERLIPFLFILIYYIIACYLFYEKLEMGPLFNLVMISVTTLIFFLILITLKFKISIHATAIWSAAGYLTAILIHHAEVRIIIFAGLIFAGLTSTSRLYLGYHTPQQVWMGAILGFFYGLTVILLFA